MKTHTNANCRLVKSRNFEIEITSGDITRLAGISQGLVGAEGIHLAVRISLPNALQAHITR